LISSRRSCRHGLVLSFPAALASACVASLSPAGAPIREAAPEGVTDGEFLGTVIGGPEGFNEPTIENAKIDALNRAAEMGPPMSSG
jgi:hypothetical protein